MRQMLSFLAVMLFYSCSADNEAKATSVLPCRLHCPQASIQLRVKSSKIKNAILCKAHKLRLDIKES